MHLGSNYTYPELNCICVNHLLASHLRNVIIAQETRNRGRGNLLHFEEAECTIVDRPSVGNDTMKEESQAQRAGKAEIVKYAFAGKLSRLAWFVVLLPSL